MQLDHRSAVQMKWPSGVASKDAPIMIYLWLIQISLTAKLADGLELMIDIIQY